VTHVIFTAFTQSCHGFLDMGDITDSERDQYVKALTRHCGDGRLTLDELEDRAGEVFAATTRAELRHALRELPPFPGDEPATARATAARAEPARPAAAPAAPRRTRTPAAHRGGVVCMGKPPAILLAISIVMLMTSHWILAAVLFAIAIPKLNRVYRFS
jgi:hypothetical protein